MRNGKTVALLSLGGTCGVLGDPCGHPVLPRRDADEALEVMGEMALVREAGALRASGHIDRSIEPPADTLGNSSETAGGAPRPGSGARQGRIPQVGKGRKLSRFCGKCGVRSVQYGKCGIRKLRNRLFLRSSRSRPPEWGPGARAL